MRGFRIATLFGIPLEINPSWLIIFVILLVSLGGTVFPETYPGFGGATYWGMGLATTLLFFGSLIAHELSHSLLSQRFGMRVQRIILFIFGGISETNQEMPSPKVEFLVAIAGPLMSFILAGIFAFAAKQFELMPGWSPAGAVCAWLAIVNVVLGLFNLLPGFPLDGGRVLRAIAWKVTGNYRKATSIASRCGQGVAIAMMAWGGLRLFNGDLFGAIWLGFLGTMIYQAAASQYGEILLASTFSRLRVSDLMSSEPMTVAPDLSLQEVVDLYLLRHPFGGYPVYNGYLKGLLQAQQVRAVPPDERRRIRVSDVMTPLGAEQALERNTTISEALQRFSALEVGRLPVMEHGEIVGMLSQSDVVRWLAWHPSLEPPESK